MMFGEQMVHRVTSIFKCQVMILMLALSLLSLKRFILSHYQSYQSSPQGLNISLNYPQDTAGSIW